MALFVAAYLGVIPKQKVQAFFDKAATMPYVGALVSKGVPEKAPVKAAPSKGSPRKRR